MCNFFHLAPRNQTFQMSDILNDRMCDCSTNSTHIFQFYIYSSILLTKIELQNFLAI